MSLPLSQQGLPWAVPDAAARAGDSARLPGGLCEDKEALPITTAQTLPARFQRVSVICSLQRCLWIWGGTTRQGLPLGWGPSGKGSIAGCQEEMST